MLNALDFCSQWACAIGHLPEAVRLSHEDRGPFSSVEETRAMPFWLEDCLCCRVERELLLVVVGFFFFFVHFKFASVMFFQHHRDL